MISLLHEIRVRKTELKQVVTEESIKDERTELPRSSKEGFDPWRWRTWEEEGTSNTTKYKNKYIVGSRTWTEWAVERNGMIAIKGESGITLPQVNFDILIITDNEELNN